MIELELVASKINKQPELELANFQNKKVVKVRVSNTARQQEQPKLKLANNGSNSGKVEKLT